MGRHLGAEVGGSGRTLDPSHLVIPARGLRAFPAGRKESESCGWGPGSPGSRGEAESSEPVRREDACTHSPAVLAPSPI